MTHEQRKIEGRFPVSCDSSGGGCWLGCNRFGKMDDDAVVDRNILDHLTIKNAVDYFAGKAKE